MSPLQPPPNPPNQKWEFWILAFLDLASKVFHEPPHPPTHLPTPEMGILDFSISGFYSIQSLSM